jgi:hypothetical protein
MSDIKWKITYVLVTIAIIGGMAFKNVELRDDINILKQTNTKLLFSGKMVVQMLRMCHNELKRKPGVY